MRINFYDTRIADDGSTFLIKEKGINYVTGRMNNPEEITRMMINLLQMNKLAEEHCYMLALNQTCRLLGIFFLSKGTVCSSPLTPREIFLRALLIGAVQIIVCHNHPSGNTSPSVSDIKVTERIKSSGDLLCIELADHIIVGENSYFSFKEAGMLRKDGAL